MAMSNDKLEYVTRKIIAIGDKASSEIEKFRGEFGNDPVSALHWSDSVFRAAARAQIVSDVNRRIEGMVAHGNSLDEAYSKLREAFTKDVVHSVGNTGCSTSPTANLMDKHLLAAKADVLELLIEGGV